VKKQTIDQYTIEDAIKILGDDYQSKGLHIYMDTGKIKRNFFSAPFRPNDYSIVVILSGKVTYVLNLLCFYAEPNTVLIISPRTIVQILEMDTNLEMIVISFTVDFLRNNFIDKNEFNAISFFASKEVANFKIEKGDLEIFISLSRQLKKENRKPSLFPFRTEIIQYTFSTIIYRIAAQYRLACKRDPLQIKRKEELGLAFFNILNENFKLHKKVRYYSDAMFITPGHLTKLLKAVTGKTAGELINDAIIFEAKVLLSNSKLSISQISSDLNFIEQSIFGKFFKRQTGLSPSEYRKADNR
jgi:AraC family transcriptional activator of pobA